MPSSLTFENTKDFRDRLMVRNLKPYRVEGVYTPNVNQVNYEIVLRDEGVYDSDDKLISDSPFSEILYTYNSYGPENGYNKDDVGPRQPLAPIKPNQGSYDFSDAKLPEDSEIYQDELKKENKYSYSDNKNLIQLGKISLIPTDQPYLPINFICSTYTPYNILLQQDPQGNEGRVSEDSFIAQLGSKELKNAFQYRIDEEIKQQTLGRQNITNAISDPVSAIQVISGKVPLIEKDWVITRPSNLIYNSVDFTARLGGAYIPSSLIDGDYFGEVPFNNNSLISNITSSIRRKLTIKSQTGSQLFLNNTGSGQKSQLFYNLSFNKFKGLYNPLLSTDNPLDTITSRIYSLFDTPPPSSFYVGNRDNEINLVMSPPGELPINENGVETDDIVYGGSEVSKLYEQDQSTFISYDKSDKAGGIVWKSPQTNLGNKATEGGGEGSQDETYIDVRSIIDSKTSDNFSFTPGSILDTTNRLVLSTPNDVSRRLKHVGNAISNVSKVFNDGYKEITKGSKVKSWTWSSTDGYINGKEYCRIFTKDTPYYNFTDLQKTDGNIRGSEYSVLDSTFNLNIAPNSRNIKEGKATKYMFSIENLAWRTSTKEGFRYQDLPECERGPNGGRIMWFPPYDITISEDTKPNFQPNSFLGRPEPIHTYKDTSRSGSIKWKMIVDHPSVMDLVASKTMEGLSEDQIEQIFDSFYAGCLKYDIYELSKKYNTIPPSELQQIQEVLKGNKSVTISKTIDKTYFKTIVESKKSEIDYSKYIGFGFYFDNDIPKTNNVNWVSTLDNYRTKIINRYNNELTTFFEYVIDDNSNYIKNNLLKDLLKDLKDGYTITINLKGTASSPASKTYNESLSERRIDSVKLYFRSIDGFSKYIDEGKLIFNSRAEGEVSIVIPKSTNSNASGLKSCNCTDNDNDVPPYDPIYSIDAMACRRVSIGEITTSKDVEREVPDDSRPDEIIREDINVPVIERETIRKDNISKRILRKLLNECDYFNYLQSEDELVFESLKKKFKYFHPSFHSMTPEGLNSRLTFLNQCTRPGETIPTIDNNGRNVYDNAKNTAFGAPPVLILRFGDFWHTKIIPSNMQFTYNPLHLDLNPEGIGIQPMVVDVTMSFTFIGGHGLKEPVERLQNALSFNFYANTEMYDERAEVTDESLSRFDDEIFENITDEVTIKNSDVKNQIDNDNGKTIGDILNQNTDEFNVTTGVTSYKNILEEYKIEITDYIENLNSLTSNVVKNYNLSILNMIMDNRNYSDGVYSYYNVPNRKSVKIFGKSEYIQNLNESFNKLISDINNENQNVLKEIKKQTKGSKKYFDIFKQNYIEYVNEFKKDFINDALDNLNKMTINQTQLIRTMEKLDIVSYNIDGYIDNDQKIIIYELNDGIDNVIDQYKRFGDTMNNFTIFHENYKNNIFTKKFKLTNLEVNDEFDNNLYLKNDADKLVYVLLSNLFIGVEFNEKYNTFKGKLLNNIGSRIINGKTFESIFDNVFIEVKREFNIAHESDSEIIDSYDNDYKDQDFTLQLTQTTLDVDFTNNITPTTNQETALKNLNVPGNWLSDKSLFNGKHKLN